MDTQNDATPNDGGTQDEHMQQSLTPTPPPTDATQDLPTYSQINQPNEGNNNGRAEDSTLVHDTQPSPPTQRICIYVINQAVQTTNLSSAPTSAVKPVCAQDNSTKDVSLITDTDRPMIFTHISA